MKLSSRKLAPKTQSFYISVIKNLLTFYRKQVKLSIKIHGVNTTPTLRNERIPEPEQIKELLTRLSPRIKMSAALIGFAGLRFQTQVSLQLEDLLDLNIQTLTFNRIPALIHIPAEKHKAGKRLAE